MRYPALTTLREFTGDAGQDRQQANRDGLASFLGDIPWLQGRMLPGDDTNVDPYAITITGSTAVEYAHGLGRAVRGFLVLDTVGNAASLETDQANIPAGLEDTHVRFYNSGGTITAKVWVW